MDGQKALLYALLMNSSQPKISDLAALAAQDGEQRYGGGRGRHSKLTRFLAQDPDAIIALMDQQNLTWSALASHLGTLGIRDGAGKPPTAERTRKAFWTIQAGKGRKKPNPPITEVVQAETTASASTPVCNLDLAGATRQAENDILDLLCGAPIPLPTPNRKKNG